MDPPRRGADRLARFYQAKRSILRPEVLSGKTVRSFAGEAGTTSLRTLITGSVVSFVPPALPLRHGPTSCTHALAALHASGGFTFGVRVETSTPDPVAIVIGFCTNDGRGAWTGIIAALTFASDSLATSRTSVGVFQIHVQRDVTGAGALPRIAGNPGRAFFQARLAVFIDGLRLRWKAVFNSEDTT